MPVVVERLPFVTATQHEAVALGTHGVGAEDSVQDGQERGLASPSDSSRNEHGGFASGCGERVARAALEIMDHVVVVVRDFADVSLEALACGGGIVLDARPFG